MSNTLVTIDTIADRAIAVAHEKCSFLGTVYRDYDEEFGKRGAKVGDTIRIRKPNQYTRRQGSRIMDVQDQSEATTTLVCSTQDGVDMRFNSAELALSIDEFTERYIEPAISVLVSGIESDVLAALTKKVYNTVGTAGTVPGSSSDITVFGNARAKLNQYLAPKDQNRFVQLDSVTMASVVNGTKSLFHDGGQIKEAFREGFISRNAMADWYENERTLVLTNGSDHTSITVNDTVATGDEVITTAGASVVVGTVFTIADVYAVHPETKVAYNHLQQFTITAISGNDWTVSPAFISSGAKQNINALPANSAAITCVGSASTAYRYGLMYHKNAFAFVTADLPLMADAASCVRKQLDGLSLRVWQGSDIRNDEKLMRIDILYGYEALRAEHAVRIICN